MIPIWQGEEATYGLLQPDGSSNASRLYEAVWWQKRG